MVDFFGGIIGFPLWWYGQGFARWTKGLWRLFSSYRATLGVSVWVKNLFVPMYGRRDIGGRIVSFFMRSAMIVIRSFVLVFVGLFFLLFLFVYLLAPLVVVAMLVYHLIGVIA